MAMSTRFRLGGLAGFVVMVVVIFTTVATLWANPMAPRWRLINSSAPARYNHKCAYDIDRERVVLFGGLDSMQAMPSDVWEFSDSRVWNQIQAPGPGGRVGHGLCYDSTAHLTILFGGQNQSGQYLNDTWGWNGSEWTKLDSTGPSPRAFFVMTYDSQRQRIVLFGGAGIDTIFGDTWEWDGSHWLLRTTAGPPARVCAGMAFYDYYEYPNMPSGKCILFGGQADFEGSALNDTWAWDGSSWTPVSAVNSPSPRAGHSATSNITWRAMTLFGGQSGTLPDTVFGDTWELYMEPFETIWFRTYVDDEPPARSLAAMVSYTYIYPILLLGGERGDQIFHDVWAYPVYYRYVVGDVNDNGIFNGLDVTYGVAYFKGGPPPPYLERDCFPGHPWYAAGDVNASCSFNGLDITYMVAYFKGGPALIPCPDCPPE